MKEYTKEDFKNMLNMKVSQYEMLNKTLLEMIEKGSSEVVIDNVKSSIAETSKEIEQLQDKIEGIISLNEKKENDVEYSFYDNVKKPKLAKSVKMEKSSTKANLYDSIKKEDYKPYNTPYNKLNYENLYNTIEKEKSRYDVAKDENTTLKPLNVKINDKYLDEIITNSNRFLVKFNGGLNINEWLVKSVDFSPIDNHELIITVQDHLATSSNGKKYPIISQIRSKVNSLCEPTFTISIEYLDRTGCTLYTERYHSCRITDVIRSSASYEVDAFNTISFTVNYSDITYETSKQ